MAAVVEQATSGTVNGTVLTLTFGGAITSGNSVIVCASIVPANSITSVQTGNGTSLSAVQENTETNGAYKQSLYAAHNVTDGSTTVVITYNASSNYVAEALEASGIDTTPTATYDSSAASSTTHSLTTADGGTDALHVGRLSPNSGATASTGDAGSTTVEQAGTTFPGNFGAMGYRVASGASSINIDLSAARSIDWIGAVYPAAGGGSILPQIMHHRKIIGVS